MKVERRSLVKGARQSRELVLSLDEARLLLAHLKTTVALLDKVPQYDSCDAMGVNDWSLRVERDG